MKEFVWLDDELIPLEQARVSVNNRGFLYGDGLFETLRAEAGTPLFLKEHVARLKASARVLRLDWPSDFRWEQRLNRLLAANDLEQRPARVKILLSRGEVPGLGLPEVRRPTLVVWAQPYEPPTPAEYAAGWPVAVFPERRASFIGRHKSLNYLFNLAARQYALDQGAKEAIMLEADGLVSEGAATSLVFRQHGNYFTPLAASALPGVTVAALSRGLSRRGLALETAATTLAQLREAEGVWLANALMGLMPVAAIDGKKITISNQSDFLQKSLWAEAERL